MYIDVDTLPNDRMFLDFSGFHIENMQATDGSALLYGVTKADSKRYIIFESRDSELCINVYKYLISNELYNIGSLSAIVESLEKLEVTNESQHPKVPEFLNKKR